MAPLLKVLSTGACICQVALIAGAQAGSAIEPATDYLATGRLRPAFDHIGTLGGQLDAAIASRCTLVYGTGIGAYSYSGLPPKATMEAHLAKLKEYNRKAHAGGVGVMLSYLCATSIVDLDRFATNWNDYFPNRPAGFTPEKMLQQDIEGHNLPSWYGGKYAPADMWNPYWREYTKLTIKLAAESGHDGIYFDNPTVHPNGNFSPYAMKAWARFLKREGVSAAEDDLSALRALPKSHADLWRRFRVTEAADFIREMHDYGRSLKPGFLLTVNNSLNSWDTFYSQPQRYGYSIPEQSRSEDLITIEDMSSQPRRQGESYVSYGSTLRLIHAIGNGRRLSVCTTDGDYIGPPELMGLSIAECTAHDAAYMVWSCWDPAFRNAFAAGVARYHEFLETNAALFGGSRPLAEVLLVWPYENWLRQSVCPTANLAQELSAANIQYDVVTEADLTAGQLKTYRAVAYSAEEGLMRPGTAGMLHAYEQQGGAVVPAGHSDIRLKKMLEPFSVTVEGQTGVRAVVRRTKAGACLLHLYNLNVTRGDSYHASVTPVENLRVVWHLPPGETGVQRVRLLTPDAQGTSGRAECTATQVKGRVRLEFVVPKLWTWTVVIPQRGA